MRKAGQQRPVIMAQVSLTWGRVGFFCLLLILYVLKLADTV
jgi:hypothetical protein